MQTARRVLQIGAGRFERVDLPVREELPLEVEEFLTWLRVERGRSTNTLSAYRGDLRRYLSWLRGRGRALADVDEGDVTDYVGHLRAEGPGTRPR